MANPLLILTNPSSYLIRKLKKDLNNTQRDENVTTFKKNQKEKERSSELRDLRALDEQVLLPKYSENI